MHLLTIISYIEYMTAMCSAWHVLILILGFVTQSWAFLGALEDELFVEGGILPANR